MLTATTTVTSDYNGEDVSCFGSTDGSAIVNPTGGTGSYDYLWDAATENQTTFFSLSFFTNFHINTGDL